MYTQICLLPTTAQWIYMLLHVSAELFGLHQGDLFYRHKQLVTCHRMVKV
jgi:hypothetical protein